MSTRGAIGFVLDGEEKLTYNHSDSYPSYLGLHMLEFCREADWDRVRGQVRALHVIRAGERPTAEQADRLVRAGYADLTVSERRVEDWYCLLRNTQGRPDAILEVGLAEDGSAFPTDSLFCEWAYVTDLDANTFEVYEGFQTEPHDRGRFAERGQPYDAGSGRSYYSCRLIAAWPLGALPEKEAFLSACADPAGEA